MRKASQKRYTAKGGTRLAAYGDGKPVGRRPLRGSDTTTSGAPAQSGKIRVLLADDHEIVRQGVKMILTAEPDIEVVGEAEDGRQAVEMATRLKPDVAVLDISMPGIDGIQATRHIKAALPNVHILALSMHDDDTYVFQMLKVGGSGYVLKRAAATDLVQAIRAVRRGKAFLYPAVAKAVVADYLKRVESGEGRETYDGLTEREREILTLVAEGTTNQDISEKLYISIKTVQTHRTHIMEKLGLHDRTMLVRYAVRKGLIEP
jgi:two-component system, NarL family, response regulator NreC